MSQPPFRRWPLNVAGNGRRYSNPAEAPGASGSSTGAGVLQAQAAQVLGGTQAPLVQRTDLTYLGSFRLPDVNGFDYAAPPMAWNASNGSIVLTGNQFQNQVSEVIPPTTLYDAINGPANYFSLPTATIVQSLTPAYGGFVNGTASMGDLPGDGAYASGHLVWGNQLVFAAGNQYGQANNATWTHGARPLNLSNPTITRIGKIRGNLSGYDFVRLFSGYMWHVPPEWQSAFGGPAMTGYNPVSVRASASNGPSAMVFSPDDLINGTNTVTETPVVNPGALASVSQVNRGTPVLGYPIANALQGGDPVIFGEGPFPLWSWNAECWGACIPNGTRTVMFFGTNGIGPQRYGDNAEVYDPVYIVKGNHAYPYRHQIWLYDLLDLIDVRNGLRTPASVQPYAWGGIKLPFDEASYFDTNTGFTSANVPHTFANPDPTPLRVSLSGNGMVYDPAGRRVIFRTGKGPFGNPIFHVYRVNNAVAP